MCDKESLRDILDDQRSPEYKKPVLMFLPGDPAAEKRAEVMFHQARGDPGYPPPISPPRDAESIYREFLQRTKKNSR